MMAVEIEAKRLELLRELVPGSALIAMLVNPTNAQAGNQSREVQRAAGAIGQQVLVLTARPNMKSKRLLRPSSESGPARCSLAPIRFSQASPPCSSC
jgi:hypothetical protein